MAQARINGAMTRGIVWDRSQAALGAAAAWLAARSRFGVVAMNLSLPTFGVGLSYTDVGQSAELAGLMIAGSVYACLVSMLWPERPQGGARHPRWSTACGSEPPERRRRRSASSPASSTSAGPAPQPCW